MVDKFSEFECAECGKQLWKRKFDISIDDTDLNFYEDEGTIEFCSKKCARKWMDKKIKVFRVDI